MHILVTDRLVCARCGPGFGLVLLADRIENRRVLSGSLGCANCRELYPIADGFGDLRFPRLPAVTGDPLAPDDPEEAVRLGALLGVREGPGVIVLIGPIASAAPRLARMIPEIEVLAVYSGLRDREEEEGVTRIEVSDSLPLESGSVRGVVLQGRAVRPLVGEALRSLAPGGRLVLLGAVEEAATELVARGAKILMRGEQALVAVAG